MPGDTPLLSPRRVCLVVGGGDAPGVNAILRAFVHAARRRSIELLGCRRGFEGLLAEDAIGPISAADVRGILPRGGCFLGCSTRVNPFFAAVPSEPEPRDLGGPIVDRLRARGAGALVLVGGDGTMLAAERFQRLGMPCVGIPKTIDNDLAGTDLTVGFETAVETATHAIDSLHSTAEAHARVMVVEVMGRNAGWIALHAGIAGGADVVLIPEIPYRLGRVVAKIREREALGMRFTIVVVSEGARPLGEEAPQVEAARPGHLARLGGAGARLVRQLADIDLGHEVRLTVLGHLQRGGAPSPIDRVLGTRLGALAAELCDRGAFGRMTAVRDGRVCSVPLAQAGNRTVSREDALLAAARDVNIELAS